jgi:hypothetical protein
MLKPVRVVINIPSTITTAPKLFIANYFVNVFAVRDGKHSANMPIGTISLFWAFFEKFVWTSIPTCSTVID